MSKLAIIGGSGLEKLIDGHRRIAVNRYGIVHLMRGEMNGKECIFLPRHGFDHSIPPHKINHRANMYALAKLGATDVLSLCAVGSLNPEKFQVGDIATVRGIFDMKAYPTFFNRFKKGAMHTDMSVPYSPELIEKVQKAAQATNVSLKDGAVLIDTTGPRYESADEVRILASWGIDVAGMTTTKETILSNELRKMGFALHNATVAIVTNFGTGISKVKLDQEHVVAVVKEKEEATHKLVYELISLV